jgi:hypothetical protein
MANSRNGYPSGGESLEHGDDPKWDMQHVPAAQTGETVDDATDDTWSMPSGEITGEDAYLAQVHQRDGADTGEITPFDELSDMAIQMYEAEADKYNAQLRQGEQ